MPIRFPCESCGRVLSVRSRHAGRRANCPQCDRSLVVPSPELAAAAMQKRTKPAAADSPPAAEDREEDDPLAEFVVYDDFDEFDELDEDRPAEREAPVGAVADPNRVAVPRIVLYVQGVLLGLVALVFFVLGVIVGTQAGTGRGERADRPEPCAISGKVAYLDHAGRETPDGDAVVIVLPKQRAPEKGIPYEGLSPDDPPPAAGHAGLAAIHRLGGAYARADAEGNFRLRVPDRGDYYVLVISHGSYRDADEPLANEHMAQLGSYIAPAPDLIGRREYRWQDHRVLHDRTLNVLFN